MNRVQLARAFFVLWWMLGIVLFVLSVRTVRLALGFHHDPHALVLGAIEAVAALVFLIPKTMRVGGTALLLVLALAAVFHTLRGEFAGPLLVDAAGVLFIMVHGAISPRALWSGHGEHPA
jgi:hypothetical protein